jgi:transposase-like protein
VFSRYAGAMLLHAYPGQAGEILPQAAGGDGRETALLAAVSMGFALGAATAEQVKHLVPAEAGPLAGLAVLPSLRTLRPRLAAIADATDPLALQAALAAAMLAASPETSGVYYVDDHFVPYAGAKPVGKGRDNKRGRADRGRADTHVTTADGRAVCFVTGEPSGLSVTLPKALAELNKAVLPGTEIMPGFDRGGAYPAVFAHCRENNVHWVTCRRAPLAVPGMLPVLTTITVNGSTRIVAWTDEEVQLKDYGAARQLTLFEHGRPVLQVLTPDFDACPAALPGWLKSRWREEHVQEMLRTLADPGTPVTHETLNGMSPWQSVAYLRDLLMLHGVLPPADRNFLTGLSFPSTAGRRPLRSVPPDDRPGDAIVVTQVIAGGDEGLMTGWQDP